MAEARKKISAKKQALGRFASRNRSKRGSKKGSRKSSKGKILVHSLSGQEFTFSAGMTVEEIEKQMYEDARGTETASVRRKAASPRIVLVKGEQGVRSSN